MPTNPRSLCALVAALTLGAGCGQALPPLAAGRLVAAYTSADDAVHLRMSPTGEVWTEPLVVNGGPVAGGSSPVVVHEAGLYHLYWQEASGAVRYGTSRDGTSFLLQGTPLLTLPPSPSFTVARGPGRHVALTLANGVLTAHDLDEPTVRSVVAPSARRGATVVHDGSRFVAATDLDGTRVGVFASPDGRAWASLGTIPSAAVSDLDLTFTNGGFRLALRNELAGNNLPGISCSVLGSADAVTWAPVPSPTCGNAPARSTALSLHGDELFLMNQDNRQVNVSRNGGPLVETHLGSAQDRVSYVVADGPRLAALHLDELTVERGDGSDLTLVSLGFQVRVGRTGSARVSFPTLREFATDVPVGSTVAIPHDVSPYAWRIEPPPVALEEPDSELDVAGVILVGIERGSCPTGPIVDRLGEARDAIQAAMNDHLASASTQALLDEDQRDEAVALVTCKVERQLAGQDPGVCTGTVDGESLDAWDVWALTFAPLGRAATSSLTDLACGFNQDEQLSEAVILFLGTPLFTEGPSPRSVYRLHHDDVSRRLDPVFLRNEDGTTTWRVTSRVRYLGHRDDVAN